MPKTQIETKFEKLLKSLSQTEKDFIESIYYSELIFEAALDQLEIDPDDLVFRAEINALMREQSEKFLANTVLNSLDPIESQYLESYLNQNFVLQPELSTNELILQYAQNKPKLLNHLAEKFTDYIQKFVKDFNRLHKL